MRSPTQMRLNSQDGRLYSVERDFAHAMPWLVRALCKRLTEKSAWLPLRKYLQQAGLDEPALNQALEALICFIKLSEDESVEDFRDGSKKSGWDAVPEEAKVAVMASLGIVITGAWFESARDAAMGPAGFPKVGFKEMETAGEEAYKAMTRRSLSSFFGFFKKKPQPGPSLLKDAA